MSSTSRSESREPHATPRLAITGAVRHPLSLDRDALAAIREGAVADVGALVPGKRGRAVRLAALAAHAGIDGRAEHLQITSSDPSFAVSVPLAEVIAHGIVVFEEDGSALPREKGGPFRLLVPGHADECVNVKQLARLEFSAQPGRDTRPRDDAEHARLHAARRASTREQH